MKTLLHLLWAALGVGLIGTGCVRLSPPDTYTCTTNSDCDSNEKCVDGVCRSKSFCYRDMDCDGGQICTDSDGCGPPLCTEATNTCGDYACEQGRCLDFCDSDSGCRSGLKCQFGACLVPGQFANGESCDVAGDCQSKQCCSGVCADSCPKDIGGVCSVATDCASGYCCARTTHSLKNCAAAQCPSPPECTMDLDCGTGQHCSAETCFVDLPPAPAVNGAPCQTPQGCKSGLCEDNVCRGVAGSLCSSDSWCETGHRCCRPAPGTTASTCGGPNGGCPGSIGAACMSDFDCLVGTCNNGYWCSMPCTTNADCGVSPWGVSNACETNGNSVKLCFPGCTTSSDCTNLNEGLSCYPALDSTAMVCASG
jgi:hypothetical protein